MTWGELRRLAGNPTDDTPVRLLIVDHRSGDDKPAASIMLTDADVVRERIRDAAPDARCIADVAGSIMLDFDMEDDGLGREDPDDDNAADLGFARRWLGNNPG